MLDQNQKKGVIPNFVTQMAFSASSSPEDFAARHGVSCRGLIPYLAKAAVLKGLYPGLAFIPRMGDGAIVGFAFKWANEAVSIDYRKPASIRAGMSYLQPSNRNLARLARTSIEEKLAHYLRRPCVEAWESECQALNVQAWKLRKGETGRGLISLRAAARLASAIVNEAITNAFGHEKLGALVVARKFPPSLRPHVSDALGAGLNAHEVRDVYYQLPILALWPRAVAKAAAGHKLRDITRQLGLPPGARRVHPGAVGRISYLLRTAQDADADAGDLGWLSQAVCSALPDAVFRQRMTVSLAIKVAMRWGDQRAETTALWMATEVAGKKRESALSLDDLDDLAAYVGVAEPIVEVAAVDRWHVAMPLDRAMQNARSLQVHLINLSVKGGSFARPSWAPDTTPLVKADWRLVRIVDTAMLVAEARRLKNCSVAYAGACASGEAALYVIRRPATGRDKPSDIHADENGLPVITSAMVEIRRRPDGAPRLLQCKGPLNKPASASIRQAIARTFPTW
jgi:hypothetical protein